MSEFGAGRAAGPMVQRRHRIEQVGEGGGPGVEGGIRDARRRFGVADRHAHPIAVGGDFWIGKVGHSVAAHAPRERGDVLRPRRLGGEVLGGVAEAASTRQDRYLRSEVRFVATVAVKTLQTEVDQLSKRYRELDTRLQELNWKTELI